MWLCTIQYCTILRPLKDYLNDYKFEKIVWNVSFKSRSNSSFPLFLSAPCMPMNLQLALKNSSCVAVSWTAHNRAATYTVRALGDDSVHNCTTSGNSCDITELPCGSTYEISVTATSAAGQSLPSYTGALDTGESSKV